ncbi:MAG TPA: membrane protein insertion efficiency factor YidD [Gammaproteobacteria bacterium]
MRQILIVIIKAYRLTLSPYIGGQCRFHPTCSVYAQEAIERYGALRGGWLAIRRIGRCQPLCAGGIDPVPDDGNGNRARPHRNNARKISHG